MGNLSKTGISSGAAFNHSYLSHLYDFFTGTTAYDNINIADWDYINAGGIKGEDGFGFKNNSGTIQIKTEPEGAWGDVAAGEIRPSGSAGSIVFNDSTSFGADDKFYFVNSPAVFQVGDTNHTGNKTKISMSDDTGLLELAHIGVSAQGDSAGMSLGSYITVDDVNEVIRIQSEGSVIIGDDDWIGYGNGTYIEVNDVKQQISMSSTLGVSVSTLSTGGAIVVGADAYGTLNTFASDYRLKKNIEPIESALDKVLGITGVNFEWKSKEEGNDHFAGGTGKRIGLIAQDVEKVLPEVVFKEGEYYGLNYSPLVSLLIEAVKERQKQIENLKERLNKFE
jgi:hypothetical protein